MVVASGAKLRNAGADPSTLYSKGSARWISTGKVPLPERRWRRKRLAGLAAIASGRRSRRQAERKAAIWSDGPYRARCSNIGATT